MLIGLQETVQIHDIIDQNIIWSFENGNICVVKLVYVMSWIFFLSV